MNLCSTINSSPRSNPVHENKSEGNHVPVSCYQGGAGPTDGHLDLHRTPTAANGHYHTHTGTCRRCNNNLGEKYKNSTSNKRYWWCSDCTCKTYLRQNTVLENSNLRFERFVMLIYSFAERNTTYKQTRQEACLPAEGYADNGMSNSTVNRWYQYFCFLCNKDIKKIHFKIGGVGKIVEMGESMFGKMKYGKGNPTKRRRTWVFGGKCRETGRVFVKICPFNKRTKKALWPIIQENVMTDTMLFTDGWRAYRKLPTLGYQHRWVDHSKYYMDPNDQKTRMSSGHCAQPDLQEQHKGGLGYVPRHHTRHRGCGGGGGEDL